MKLPKHPRAARREIDKVVQKSLKVLERNEIVGKQDFEAMLGVIIHQIHTNRAIELNQISLKTNRVINAITTDYENLPDELRDWKALVIFIYLRYHYELGINTSIFEG